MIGAVTLTDGWLQLLAAGGGTGLLSAVTWLANNQRRSNDSLANNATATAHSVAQVSSMVEKVVAIVETQGERIERLERWQDTDRYAEVIERRRAGGQTS